MEINSIIIIINVINLFIYFVDILIKYNPSLTNLFIAQLLKQKYLIRNLTLIHDLNHIVRAKKSKLTRN